MYKRSIQRTAAFGYYGCIALIICIALLNYIDLNTLSKKIETGMVISEFSDTVLEMRRFEKNFMLYDARDDFNENARYTEKAEDIVDRNREAFNTLASVDMIAEMESVLKAYKALMKKYSSVDRANAAASHSIESDIRNKGRRLSDLAEKISHTEREHIQAIIKTSNRLLVASIAILIVAGLVVGKILSQKVIQPLQELEESMRLVAEGKFNTLSIDTRHMEMASLNNAFNKMRREIELRQLRFTVQSEKLATLGTMVSGVAHQLNNPLSNISTSCQILDEEIEEKDFEFKKELLLQIEDQVDRAKNIVQSLLEFSKNKELRFDPLPLKDLIRETIDLVRGEIPPGVTVAENIPWNAWVVADRQRIEQVFLNIIKNALDAMPESGTVSISSEEDHTAKEVLIKIKDTGTGIEPESLDKIFSPFFTTKAEEKGTGLGLFVSREILKEHGGTIDVESKVAEGTTFIIRLPLKEL